MGSFFWSREPTVTLGAGIGRRPSGWYQGRPARSGPSAWPIIPKSSLGPLGQPWIIMGKEPSPFPKPHPGVRGNLPPNNLASPPVSNDSQVKLGAPWIPTANQGPNALDNPRGRHGFPMIPRSSRGPLGLPMATGVIRGWPTVKGRSAPPLNNPHWGPRPSLFWVC